MHRGLCVFLVAAACGPPPDVTCSEPIAPGELVITEVFADAAGSDGADETDAGNEWFEIYNASDRTIPLRGVTITSSRADGSLAATHTIASGQIAPGAYFVLGNAVGSALPAYVDYGYGSALSLYNSGGGELALACGSDDIDSAPYADVRRGHARELGASAGAAPDAVANDDLASWCEADAATFAGENYGTPRAASDCVAVPAGDCIDARGAVRAIVPPIAGAAVISEVMPNPSGDETLREWVEIANTSAAAFDLTGLAIDRADDTRPPDVVAGPACNSVAAGDYALFARARDAAQNDGLPTVDATFGFSLTNSHGSVQIEAGAIVLDSFAWATSTDGRSWAVDPGALTASGNDDPAHVCAGSASYGSGSNHGTPRAANPPCPPAAPPPSR